MVELAVKSFVRIAVVIGGSQKHSKRSCDFPVPRKHAAWPKTRLCWAMPRCLLAGRIWQEPLRQRLQGSRKRHIYTLMKSMCFLPWGKLVSSSSHRGLYLVLESWPPFQLIAVLPRHIELSSVHSAQNQQQRLPLMMDALAGRQHVVQDRLCFGCPCCEGTDSACHTDMV